MAVTGPNWAAVPVAVPVPQFTLLNVPVELRLMLARSVSSTMPWGRLVRSVPKHVKFRSAKLNVPVLLGLTGGPQLTPLVVACPLYWQLAVSAIPLDAPRPGMIAEAAALTGWRDLAY